MESKLKQRILVAILTIAIFLASSYSYINVAAASSRPLTEDSEQFNDGLSQLLNSQDTKYFFGEMKLRIGSKSLEIDERITSMDVAPEIANGRTMLPIRHVAEAVGAKVIWDGKTKSATVKSQSGDTITCTIGKKSISVNGNGKSLDVAPYVKKGRTYLPIRAVSEALDFDVQWEQKTKTVTLTAPYQTARVIALADENLVTDYLGAQTVLYDGSGMWVLQFNSPAEAKVAMALLKAEGVTAEPDTYILPISSGVSIDLWETSGEAYSWGVSNCHFDSFVANNSRIFQNSGIVAVVDTGVDATHSFLSGKVLPGYDFIDGDKDPYDENRHGTHVAGTVIDCVRGAPVNILPVKVLGADGHGTSASVAAGVKYAANHNADVINLSLGGDHSPSQEAAIDYAVSRGSVVCVSAGNDNADTAGQCPAHITSSGVVVVSAGNSSHNKASFSNYGSSVDLMAPGVNIKSSVPGNNFILLDGTSMATPHASAAAILLDLAWGKELSAGQLEEKVHTATTYGAWHDSIYGYGFLDMSKASVPSPSIPSPSPTPNPVPVVPVTEVGFRDSDGNGSHNLLALGFREDTVQDHKFNAYVFPQDATNQTVVWSSSDSSIATVTQDGYIKVTGNIGETIITASCDGKSASIRVYYYQKDPAPIVPVSEVGFRDSDGNGSHNLLGLGFREDTVQDHKFNAYVLPQNATNQTVVWSSSDNSIATVTQDGYIRVTGKIGETIITASCGGKSASIKISYYIR